MKQQRDGEIKKIKKPIIKKEYVFIFFLTAIVIVIFLSGSKFNLFSEKTTRNNQNFVIELEENLKNLLSDVKGAGKVNVMITVDGSGEDVVLKNVETIVENGVKTTKETIVLIGGKPYVTKSLNPSIVGVVVVTEGADDLSVRMTITEIITTTLNVSSESVRIIKMK